MSRNGKSHRKVCHEPEYRSDNAAGDVLRMYPKGRERPWDPFLTPHKNGLALLDKRPRAFLPVLTRIGVEPN